MSRGRTRLLGIAFGFLLLDALLAAAFTLMAPADSRRAHVLTSRHQANIVTIQGIVVAIDAVLSSLVVLHVVKGVLCASLEYFLEAAATKLLQAVFFSLMQTGYPTVPRLFVISSLLVLRVTTAALIFRSVVLSGSLSSRPSRSVPKVR